MVSRLFQFWASLLMSIGRDLYLWASTIFVSRAFSAKVLSGVIPESEVPEENISVLLPFIDILNHRPLAKVEWRAGTENVDFVVLEDVSGEQEIANNYGPRNNEQRTYCEPAISPLIKLTEQS